MCAFLGNILDICGSKSGKGEHLRGRPPVRNLHEMRPLHPFE